MYLPATFLYNQPLSAYSSIKIGGNARKVAMITDEQQLLDGLLDSPYVVIGAGSNILFSDKGFDDQIILIRNDYAKVNGTLLTVGAGASLIKTAKMCGELGLSGLEWAIGIPSSVGGAVFMNAGAFSGDISQTFLSCKVLRDNKIVDVCAKDCGFGYRTSVFNSDCGERHSRYDIILSANFELKRDDTDSVRKRMTQNLAARKKSQPSGLSLGSVFKNADKAAGYYIDQAGLKGRTVGTLRVSEKHANFIINSGGGTARDFLHLVDIVKTEVYHKFGVILKEEFIKIGEF